MDDVRAVTTETLPTFCSNLKTKVRLKRLVANKLDLYKSTLFEYRNQIWCWKLQLWVPFNISIASTGLDLWRHARKSIVKYCRKKRERVPIGFIKENLLNNMLSEDENQYKKV